MALIDPNYPADHPRNDPRNYPVSIMTDPPVPDEKFYIPPEFAKQPDPRMGTWDQWTKPSQPSPYPQITDLPNVTKQMPGTLPGQSGDLMNFITQLLKQLQAMGVQLPKPPNMGGGMGQGLQGILQQMPQQGQQGLPGQGVVDQIMQRIGPLTKQFNSPY